jgi:hypothetical protein
MARDHGREGTARGCSILSVNWREIAISLIDRQKGERKAHTCVNADYNSCLDNSTLALQCVRMQRRLIVRGIASLGLAVLSVGAIYLIDSLPFSQLREMSDSLKLPAFVIAGVLAPEGIHGENPILFLYLAIIALPVTYAIFWFGVLSLLARLRSKPHSKEL